MIRRNAVAAVLLSSATVLGLCMPVHAQDPSAQMPALPGQAIPADPTLPSAVPTPAAGAPAALPALPTLPSADPAAQTAPDAAAPAPAGLPALLSADPAAAGATLPASMPALPGTDPAAAGATLPGALPALGATPASFGTTANATLPGALPSAGIAGAVPTPPPLSEIGVQADSATTAGADQATLYSFLFVELDEYGIVRHQFTEDVANRLRDAEILRLEGNRRQQGFGPAILGVTPLDEAGLGLPQAAPTTGIRAAAEWDFYYGQLELYDRFVREKLVPGTEGLPELEYDALNALQERQDLFESFQEAAIQQNSDEYNANREFYERLARREDRRRSYLDWLELSRQQVESWSEVWARKVYGDRWADGEEVRLDDWYYGVDFNSANPVQIAIDDREYVISRQPVDRLKDGQLNVISSNFTPYDIIDANGELKNPVMETLRGTMVMPPAPPVYLTLPEAPVAAPATGAAATQGTAPAGTIEIVGGVTSE